RACASSPTPVSWRGRSRGTSAQGCEAGAARAAARTPDARAVACRARRLRAPRRPRLARAPRRGRQLRRQAPDAVPLRRASLHLDAREAPCVQGAPVPSRPCAAAAGGRARLERPRRRRLRPALAARAAASVLWLLAFAAGNVVELGCKLAVTRPVLYEVSHGRLEPFGLLNSFPSGHAFRA